jgi:hypothetical protein
MLILSIAGASLAQEVVSDGQAQPEVRDGAEVTTANGDVGAADRWPRREIAFEVSDEEVELSLFRADPELLNQRFVAHVDIYVPARSQFSLPQSFYDLAWCEGYNLLVSNTRQQDSVPLGDFFARMADKLDNDPAMTRDRMEFFSSDAVRDHYVTIAPTREGRNDPYFRFRILAPSEDLARQRAETLVRMLDHAIASPLQQHLRGELQTHQQDMEALQKQLTEAKELAARLVDQYKKASEAGIDRDELSRLTTERRLMDVDLAGIRARIDSAEQILAKLRVDVQNGKPVHGRIEKVEEIKITAEVDLAGLAARRKVLDQLIDEGNDHAKLGSMASEAENSVNSLAGRVRSKMGPLEAAGELERTYSILFTPKDNKIVIHPIKWTGTE